LASELESSCSRAERDADALATLRTLAHRLTGTAGSYGFHGISAAAEGLAQVLEDSAPWPSITERADRLIGLMRKAETSVADEH
jgi:HPt (histidine-containing phosphotransfer) domain-containing protein